jgi:carbon monoxide dehydrogenase subunit G
MKVTGSATLHAPKDKVWQALQDPQVLARTLPGCEQLEVTGPDQYRMRVSAGVASIKGTYNATVRMADQDPPNSYTLKASGQGGPGTVDAEARVRLSEQDGQTRLDYDADAVVGGVIGGVGQRMLVGVAKKTADQFFSAVDRELTGAAVPAAPAAPAAEAPAVAAPVPAVGQVFRPAPAPAAGAATSPASLLAAALAGAAIALAGVLVGRRLAGGGRGD